MLRIRPISITRSLRAVRDQPCVSGTRYFSSSRPQYDASADPKAIAEAFLSKFAQGQTFKREQVLDANQLRLFSLALNRPKLWTDSKGAATSLEDTEPAHGTPLPPGYHLAYFTPAQLPGILGRDGTDASFNPDAPFTRRMWAGGSVQWPSSSHVLKVGDEATETTKVLSCEAKTIKKTGESMLVVGVEKEFLNGQGEVCVIDRRNWVFRTELDPTRATAGSIPDKPAELSESQLRELGEGAVVREFNKTAVDLFRFSALTFNAHRIHYDRDWARDVEGHRDVVVHGPMNLIGMLDLWRDEAGGDGVVYPGEIQYRATSPVYAGEGYRVLMRKGDGGEGAEMKVVSDDGTVCMKGSITGT